MEIAIPTFFNTPQLVLVRADEPFKGSRQGERFVLLQPEDSCAPRFKTGERVLLYLIRSSASLWEACGCGRTELLESAVDQLRFLRALPASAGKNRVAGVVSLYEAVTEGLKRVRGLSDVRVYLRSDARSVETNTDSEGVYEEYDLPAGTYRISIEVPKGLRIRFPIVAGGEGRRNRLKDLDTTEPVIQIGAETAADIDFVLMVDNSASRR